MNENIDHKTVLQKALDLLARREHSQKELRQKLARRDFPAELLDAVLEEVKSQGWQSDERFAEDYLNSRRRDLYGPERIRLELNERGVSDTIINNLINDNDDGWFDMAAQLKKKKFGDNAPENFEEKAKQMKFLQYRGFTIEQINQAFQK